MKTPMLEAGNLSKIYPTKKGPFVVLEHFNLSVYEGEFISIIGHSGCGKSTALMMMAGLSSISKGFISVNGHEIYGASPERAMIFQSPSLFPWMTTFENVMLGVKQVFPHITREQRRDICEYYLSKVGLYNHLHKKVSELSNGMKQRVGIARAFALKPKVLLLDEPFGMLDSLTRAELQDLLIHVWSKEKITAVMVTHDVDEALFLSDKVVMMTTGPYAKVGKICNIPFPRPRERFDVIEHKDYYRCRGELLDFLHGTTAKRSPGTKSRSTLSSTAALKPTANEPSLKKITTDQSKCTIQRV